MSPMPAQVLHVLRGAVLLLVDVDVGDLAQHPPTRHAQHEGSHQPHGCNAVVVGVPAPAHRHRHRQRQRKNTGNSQSIQVNLVPIIGIGIGSAKTYGIISQSSSIWCRSVRHGGGTPRAAESLRATARGRAREGQPRVSTRTHAQHTRTHAHAHARPCGMIAQPRRRSTGAGGDNGIDHNICAIP
jgi:hypothetical protein